MKKSLFTLTLIIAIIFSLGISAGATDYNGLCYEINEDGTATLVDCDMNISGHLDIPSSVDGYTVTEIGENAFADCYFLESVTIPETVTIISDMAFYSCISLTTVNMTDNVLVIGEGAFLYCRLLSDITVSENLKFLGDGAFAGCWSLTSFSIPSAITYIGRECFADCDSLTAIYLPFSVTEISSGLFWYTEQVCHVFYAGNEADFANIIIDEENNEQLSAALIVYSATGIDTSLSMSVSTHNFSVNDETVEVFSYVINESNYMTLSEIEAMIDISLADVDLTFYTVNDENYYMLREVLELVGMTVSWNNETMTVVIA